MSVVYPNLSELLDLINRKQGDIEDFEIQDYLRRNPAARKTLDALVFMSKSQAGASVSNVWGREAESNPQVPDCQPQQNYVHARTPPPLPPQASRDERTQYQILQGQNFLQTFQREASRPQYSQPKSNNMYQYSALRQHDYKAPPKMYQGQVPEVSRVKNDFPKRPPAEPSQAAAPSYPEEYLGNLEGLTEAEDLMHRQLLLSEMVTILCLEPELKLGLAPLGCKLSSTSRLYLQRKHQRLKRFVETSYRDLALEGGDGAEQVVYIGGVDRLVGHVQTSALAGIVPEPGRPEDNPLKLKRGVLDVDELAGSPQLCRLLREVSKILLRAPGRTLLLSELGTEISVDSRNYLKELRSRLGQLLLRFPKDFMIDGQKASGKVTYLRDFPVNIPSTPVPLERDVQAKAARDEALRAMAEEGDQFSGPQMEPLMPKAQIDSPESAVELRKADPPGTGSKESQEGKDEHTKSLQNRLERLGISEGDLRVSVGPRNPVDDRLPLNEGERIINLNLLPVKAQLVDPKTKLYQESMAKAFDDAEESEMDAEYFDAPDIDPSYPMQLATQMQNRASGPSSLAVLPSPFPVAGLDPNQDSVTHPRPSQVALYGMQQGLLSPLTPFCGGRDDYQGASLAHLLSPMIVEMAENNRCLYESRSGQR